MEEKNQEEAMWNEPNGEKESLSRNEPLPEERAFSRTELLLGSSGLDRLKSARVAVFGVGGVGGFAAEALARSGVGRITLVDSDRVSLSNLNRQIIALRSTVGRLKTEVMRERIFEINPDAEVETFDLFYLPENAGDFDLSGYSYVIDAVDTVSAKIELVVRCRAANVPVISSMGAGNKLDPTKFAVSDLSETSVCPLARVMRRELRKRGVEHVKVVWSTEEARKPSGEGRIPGSVAFVPSVAGLILAGEVIREIAGI